MSPLPRTKENRKLPKYWREKKGYYFFRAPPHLRHLTGGKAEISLGKDLGKAYQKFSGFFDVTDPVLSLGDLIDRYQLSVVPTYESRNTRDSKTASLARLRSSLGDNSVELVDAPAIKVYKHMVAEAKSKKIANMDLECLSHLFTMALDWGVIREHPMLGKKVTKFVLEGRERYVEDWELDAWASVANPFLVVYVQLKGATGLRQQDLLTLERKHISETELASINLKTGKALRFPLYDAAGEPTSVKRALDAIDAYYRTKNKSRARPVLNSRWIFTTRTGGSYYDLENRRSPGFKNIWQRSMKKALAETALKESFTEHDLRGKAASDLDSDTAAQDLLAHSDLKTTRKHYRRKGTLVTPTAGFFRGHKG